MGEYRGVFDGQNLHRAGERGPGTIDRRSKILSDPPTLRDTGPTRSFREYGRKIERRLFNRSRFGRVVNRSVARKFVAEVARLWIVSRQRSGRMLAVGQTLASSATKITTAFKIRLMTRPAVAADGRRVHPGRARGHREAFATRSPASRGHRCDQYDPRDNSRERRSFRSHIREIDGE